MATAPVFMGAALGLVAVAAVELAALTTELVREAMDWVKEWSSDVSESRAGPVAVAMADEKDERRLPASLVTELTSDEAAELMDDSTDVACDSAELALDAIAEVAEAILDEASLRTDERSWACRQIHRLVSCSRSQMV